MLFKFWLKSNKCSKNYTWYPFALLCASLTWLIKYVPKQKMCTKLIWLRTVTNIRLLWAWQWTFKLHRTWGFLDQPSHIYLLNNSKPWKNLKTAFKTESFTAFFTHIFLTNMTMRTASYFMFSSLCNQQTFFSCRVLLVLVLPELTFICPIKLLELRTKANCCYFLSAVVAENL